MLYDPRLYFLQLFIYTNYVSLGELPLEELLKLYGQSNEVEESASAMDTDEDEDESEVDNTQTQNTKGKYLYLSYRHSSFLFPLSIIINLHTYCYPVLFILYIVITFISK